MRTSASIEINGSVEEVWAVVSDIEAAQERIECIKKIEILEKPDTGLVGLKWKETRSMFGKEAEETMWITEAKDKEFYLTEAQNSGCLYHSSVKLKPIANGVLLEMSFASTPQTFLAKLMSPLMAGMKSMIQKAFLKDLNDIKIAVESHASGQA